MISVSDILTAIESGADIPTLAPVVRRLLMFKGDGKDDPKLFLDLVRNDPGLTVKMIRAANSPNEDTEAVDSIEAAIERLGFQNARNLALTVSFIDDDRRDSADVAEHQRMQWLWERSISTATAAENFASKLHIENLPKVRTTGLMLDIGIFFLLYNFPQYYNTILDRWQSEGGDLIEIENAEIGVDHAVVGQQLAKEWNLGIEVEEAIFKHSRKKLNLSERSNGSYYSLANLASAVLFEDRHITGLERAVRYAHDLLGFERANFIDELQRITIIADQVSIKISLSTGPALPYVDLLKGINSELGRATLTSEQMIRALEVSMRKAELLAQKLEEANHKLRDAANHDPLTRIHNRRFFEEFLNWNFNRAQRYNTTLGCMMLDIDHFKTINDTYGHLTGDRVLQGVAEVLKENLRNTDIVARYGGEEFVVLLPETKTDAVYTTAVKLNRAVRQVQFPLPEGSFSVTISIGFVSYSPTHMTNVNAPMDVVHMADVNMYSAKEAGRDRVWPDLQAANGNNPQ